MFIYFWIKVRPLVYSRSCTSRGVEMRIGETFQSRHMIFLSTDTKLYRYLWGFAWQWRINHRRAKSLSRAHTPYRCPEFQQTETNVQNKTMETEIKTRVSEWVDLEQGWERRCTASLLSLSALPQPASHNTLLLLLNPLHLNSSVPQ